MFSYRKFWKLLEQLNITQYQLIHDFNISRSTLDRLRKNGKLETTTLERICDILDCQPGDIMENLPADQVFPKAISPKNGGRKPMRDRIL